MRVTQMLTTLKAGRLGFRINEVMRGQHWFEPGCGPQGPLAMEFSGNWGPENIVEWLSPGSEKFLWQKFEGDISIEGLCTGARAAGSLDLGYFDDQKIRYTLEFEVNGTSYSFVGEKVNIKPWNLPVSHTTCYGRLVEVGSGKLISTSVTHFRLLDAPAFLTSLRLTSD